MQTFRCQNTECEEESPVGAINWVDDQHVVECWHCQVSHVLRQLPREKGAQIHFDIVGPINDSRSPTRLSEPSSPGASAGHSRPGWTTCASQAGFNRS